MEPPVRVGIDVGGTFTDFIAQGEDGDVSISKVSSTPSDPSEGVMDAIRDFTVDSNIAATDIRSLFHGSTVSTNAVIERTGAKTGLLVTEGYNAVPVVGSMARPQSHTLDPFFSEENNQFLVENEYIKSVPERIDSDGRVRSPLDEDTLRHRIREFRELDVEAIAVCYLFSFMNPEHEEKTLEIIKDEYPDCFVSLSSRVVPKIREYPRMSTTTIDAYVGPVLGTYLQSLSEKLQREGMSTEQIYLMLSHGGVVPFETAAQNTCRTILSGPAAGMKGAQYFGNQLDEQDIITMDMGGTSCDISIIEDGEVAETKEGSLDEYPLSFPMMEISTIGAGGGTQARVDGQRLQIGPESSGADPGPICYGRSGTVPTITDANVLLGRLNPDYLLGGKIEVDYDRTEQLIEERIAEPLNMDVTEAAAAIRMIVDDKMKKEIVVQLSQYGYDARDFVLFPFGGAGPTHAARIAKKLNISRVIVPPWPGINSAAGLLASDIQQEYVRSDLTKLAEVPIDTIKNRFSELEAEATNERVTEGFAPDEVQTVRRLDLRYEGQGYELTVDIDRIQKEKIRQQFNALHESRFGHQSDEPIEIVSYRVGSIVEMPPLETQAGTTGEQTDPTPQSRRDVFDLNDEQFVETPVYDRTSLSANATFTGPAVIEQLDTTIMIESDQKMTVSPTGALVIEVSQNG